MVRQRGLYPVLSINGDQNGQALHISFSGQLPREHRDNVEITPQLGLLSSTSRAQYDLTRIVASLIRYFIGSSLSDQTHPL